MGSFVFHFCQCCILLLNKTNTFFLISNDFKLAKKGKIKRQQCVGICQETVVIVFIFIVYCERHLTTTKKKVSETRTKYFSRSQAVLLKVTERMISIHFWEGNRKSRKVNQFISDHIYQNLKNKNKVVLFIYRIQVCLLPWRAKVFYWVKVSRGFSLGLHLLGGYTHCSWANTLQFCVAQDPCKVPRRWGGQPRCEISEWLLRRRGSQSRQEPGVDSVPSAETPKPARCPSHSLLRPA